MATVSVVIPTKNGGEQFQKIIEALLTQKYPSEVEILVIDSGSRDGTLEYCKKKMISVHTIPPNDFGHGKTRNLGVSLTNGEFIAFLTQDALPANPDWLSNLLKPMEKFPHIAGVFGRHLPYPSLDPYTTRDLKLHFDGFAKQPQVVQIEDESRYLIDEGYRQFLHFFSNNNSCIRRSVWEKYPFPDVEFAEDQIWAKTIIEAGYSKAYADNAMVYHSHNFSVKTVGQRAFDESSALHKLFGYNLSPNISHVILQAIRTSNRDISYTISEIKTFLKTELCIPFQQFFSHIKSKKYRTIIISAIYLVRKALLLLAHKKILTLVFYGMRAPFYNLLKQIGFYLGTKESKMPLWLLRTISLDYKIKAGHK